MCKEYKITNEKIHKRKVKSTMSVFTLNTSTTLNVKKRNGASAPVSFDKILNRLMILKDREPELENINIAIVAQKVCTEIYDGVTTSELDMYSAQVSSSMSTVHPEYLELASRIVVSNHHKNTKNVHTFKDVVDKLYNVYTIHGNHVPMIDKNVYTIAMENGESIEKMIDYERDYKMSYFGFATLDKSYLLRLKKSEVILCERPQHLWMRVAIGLYGNNFEQVERVYNEMSNKLYTHATPTLFNAGTPKNQLASCFLLAMKDDSVDGIFDTLKECSKISKHSGGIGLHIHNVRSKGSRIHGTNGTSNGIIPMLKVFNDTAKYIDQGGGKRNGSFAIYLEPWHPDIEDFLNLRKNHGEESMRARDLFYALWIPDLFMERVKSNGKWTLMDPSQCLGMYDAIGDQFKELYENYEKKGYGIKTIDAQQLWNHILQSQIETGTPYLLYKDACNRKSNQQNLGTIKSSNLCTEIIEYSSPEETAVCNLASMSLPSMLDYSRVDELKIAKVEILSKPKCSYCKLAEEFLRKNNISYTKIDYDTEEKLASFTFSTFPQIQVNDVTIGGFEDLHREYGPRIDYEKIKNTARSLTRNLNRTIDLTFYPTGPTRLSNFRHRPIGLGVQGLADLFFELRIAFDSEEARMINIDIFESIYYGAMYESVMLAKVRVENVKSFIDFVNDILQQERSSEMKRIYCEEYWQDLYEKSMITKENYNEALWYLNEIQWKEEVDWKIPLGHYSSYEGSPLSKGKFQFDLWEDTEVKTKIMNNLKHDWNDLREKVKLYGARNSLLLAPMPTASTSQIMGNNECIEPITSNIYLRRTMAGEFVIINSCLIDDLITLGLWNQDMKDKILYYEGNISKIVEIPKYLRNIYKTVWEMSQKTIINMCMDRGHFVCQSQSMNLFLESPNTQQLSSMHFYSWKNGLKTGIYYLRTKPASKAQMFTIDPNKFSSEQNNMEDEQECLTCSA
jgi:ribonucleoside-diphosphate reductase alpha subunit